MKVIKFARLMLPTGSWYGRAQVGLMGIAGKADLYLEVVQE